jgi:succinate dehydrogenase / fumarate reductase flavoprotein subunit
VTTQGGENPYKLLDELGEMMTAHCTIVRHNPALRETLAKLEAMDARVAKASCPDGAQWTNQSIRFVHQLRAMVQLAKVIAAGALARDESRGAHYKPEFENRDDENWLKTTIATYDQKARGPRLSYEPVDTRFIKPRPRVYGQGGGG